MGNVISYLAQTDTERAKREADFLKFQTEQQAKIDKETHNFESYMEERKAKLEKMIEERAKIKQEMQEELIYLIQRYEELKKLQAAINTAVAGFVCMILFNYGMSYLLTDDKLATFDNDFNTVYNNLLPIDEDANKAIQIYEAILMVSPLLPLTWPNGAKDNEVNKSVKTANGQPDPQQFRINFNGYKKDFIKNNLKKYCYNVCFCNCYEWMYNLDEVDKCDKMRTKCGDLIKSVGDLLTTDEMIAKIYEFMSDLTSDNDIMRLKLLAAKSGKGICANTIELLPKYYPKCCPTYELYEALLMILNTICYSYGYIQTKDGSKLTGSKASKPDGSTNGGQCFELPSKYIQNCYKAYYDLNPGHMWNQKDFVSMVMAHPLRVEHEITGYSDSDVWMITTTPCKDLKVILNSKSPEESLIKYVNPTQKWTYQVLQDPLWPTEKFCIAKLSVTQTVVMEKEILHTIANRLIKDSSLINASIYHSANSDIFNSFDYITCVPEGYEISFGASPTCCYMYQTILADAMKWQLVFPIDNTMTMSKINTKVIERIGDSNVSSMPQMIWAANNSSITRTKTDITDKTISFQMVTNYPTPKNMSFGNEYKYFTFVGENSEYITDGTSPEKETNKVFDKKAAVDVSGKEIEAKKQTDASSTPAADDKKTDDKKTDTEKTDDKKTDGTDATADKKDDKKTEKFAHSSIPYFDGNIRWIY